MAILKAEELAELRRSLARAESTVDWDKPIINAALQAIENLVEGAKPSINTAINTATSPYVFSATHKKKLLAYYFQQKFRREGV